MLPRVLVVKNGLLIISKTWISRKRAVSVSNGCAREVGVYYARSSLGMLKTRSALLDLTKQFLEFISCSLYRLGASRIGVRNIG